MAEIEKKIRVFFWGRQEKILSIFTVGKFEINSIFLHNRHVIPEGKVVFELQLVYNFNVPKATEITPNLSLLSEVLYESEFISQMWMLYNSHKQFVSCGDAYAQKWSVKVRELK